MMTLTQIPSALLPIVQKQVTAIGYTAVLVLQITDSSCEGTSSLTR